MSERPSRIALLGLIASLCLYVAGCQGGGSNSTSPSTPAQQQAAGSKPIRIAFNTWIGYSSFYIAQEKGLFKKSGLTVETKVIDPLAEKNAAMIRGDLDGMGGTIDSAVVSAASGVQAKVVYMFDRSDGTDGIIATKDIKTIPDLKGKHIAAEQGFVGHFFLLYMLDKYGISPSQITLIPMTTDAAGAAFVAGKVDVACTWEPYLSTAKKRPGAHVLVSSKQVEPILADTLYLSDSFVAAHPDEVQNLVDALQEANDYWLAHPSECDDIVARRWKMPKSEVVQIMKTDQLYNDKLEHPQFGTPGSKGDLYRYMSKCADLWLKAGVIHKPVDTNAIIDPDFVEHLPTPAAS